MLKTTELLQVSTPKAFRADDDEVVKVGDRVDETVRNLPKSQKSKNDKSENLTYVPNITILRKPIFLILGAKEAFNCLRQAFIEAPIL